eukprot:scaffold193_cov255-Pinguiococcus_pyrenoidosus.AAC.21
MTHLSGKRDCFAVTCDRKVIVFLLERRVSGQAFLHGFATRLRHDFAGAACAEETGWTPDVAPKCRKEKEPLATKILAPALFRGISLSIRSYLHSAPLPSFEVSRSDWQRSGERFGSGFCIPLIGALEPRIAPYFPPKCASQGRSNLMGEAQLEDSNSVREYRLP